MNLRATQAWLVAHIARQNERPARRLPRPGAAAVIAPSRTLSPAARLAIYTGMYRLRMEDVLAEDYSTLRRLLGPDRFAVLVQRYLRRHPSRHWSLGRLGRAMPRFLSGAVPVPRRALLRDVARLECAMAEAFEGPLGERLTPEAFAAVPAAAWPAMRVRAQPTLHLLRLDHPVDALVTAGRSGKRLPPVPRRRAHVAVFRRGAMAARLPLAPALAACLAALARGRTVADALRAASRVWPGPPAGLARDVFAAFRDWVAAGVFVALVPPGRARAGLDAGRRLAYASRP